MPSRPDRRHGCQGPTGSTERSGNTGTGPGGRRGRARVTARYRRRGGARGDRGELPGPGYREDGPEQDLALPRSRCPTGSRSLGDEDRG